MKTQGEIEAAICEGISRFEQEHMGRSPKKIHAHLLGDFVVVRLQELVDTRRTTTRQSPVREGTGLAQASTDPPLIETSQAASLQAPMVQEITGVEVVSLHHDISTVTGEAFILFTLAESPLCRQAKKT